MHSPKPRVFVGSSKEGLAYAHALQAALDDRMEVTVWDQGVFEISSFTLEALTEEAARSSFAILVLSPDDEVRIRGEQASAVRDNVLFELGLFVGILGRKRVFVVAPADVPDLRIPTDLLGLTFATYRKRTDGNARAALGPASSAIVQAAQATLSRDPEPGCAYTHTEKTCHVIALRPEKFSVVFLPPMRATPSLRFTGEDGSQLLPLELTDWTRYGFTVTFAAPRSKLIFLADARPAGMVAPNRPARP